ncbi:phage antirepressor Ant [Luteimonas marina]|uniref:Phage antirepressor Ant n=1 Tax=Luteimonas marina TaxID=488485 RepID=A0A5C5TYA5_9GAMM|nr:phage antirepressor KilAC domain-containing protein [Luteimonas marina]TWT18529.1 phage antirepressor Ant [Luteimonas marina]
MDAELIPVARREIATETVPTIDSAALHAFLEVATEHGQWIQRRVQTYGFEEGRDFVCSSEVTGKGRGGHNRAVYWLTLDMGKQLAMVERGPKGRQAREYFIACERAAKDAAVQPRHSQDVQAALNHPPTLRALLVDQLDARQRLEHQVAEDAPRAAAFDRLAGARGAMSLTEAAKVLGMRPRDFIAWLSAAKWIYRSHDAGSWLGHARHTDAGHLLHRVHIPVGSFRERSQVMLTPKGLVALATKLEQASLPTAIQSPTTYREEFES